MRERDRTGSFRNNTGHRKSGLARQLGPDIPGAFIRAELSNYFNGAGTNGAATAFGETARVPSDGSAGVFGLLAVGYGQRGWLDAAAQIPSRPERGDQPDPAHPNRTYGADREPGSGRCHRFPGSLDTDSSDSAGVNGYNQ